jgi:hypothetical protein
MIDFKFKHLKETNCPTCNNDISSCTIKGIHTNGEQFENVVYQCGCSLQYIPNFGRIEVMVKCPFSDEAIEANKIHISIIKSVERLIKKQKITSRSKVALMNALMDVLKNSKIEL